MWVNKMETPPSGLASPTGTEYAPTVASGGGAIAIELRDAHHVAGPIGHVAGEEPEYEQAGMTEHETPMSALARSVAARMRDELSSHAEVLERAVAELAPLLGDLVVGFVRCFQRGNKVLICGNGGSAADSQHVAGEFVNRFRYDRPPLAAIALTTDTSVLTCIGNDAAFEEVFARQVEALAVPGDIVVGISTSGLSANVLRALQSARVRGAATVGFTGTGGRLAMGDLCDLCLAVPSTDTPRIQEAHEFLWHALGSAVEDALFPREVPLYPEQLTTDN